MGTATLKNMILAALIATPINFAFADSSSSMEAGMGCDSEECMMAGQSAFGQATLQRINTEAMPEVQRATATVSSPRQWPLSARIGRVQTNYNIVAHGESIQGAANGVLISPCLVLTNQHVVFGDERSPNTSGNRSITFSFGEGPSGARFRANGTPVYWGQRGENSERDFAIVRLPSCPGRVVGWVQPVARTPEQIRARSIRFAGVTLSATRGELTIDDRCRVTGRTENAGLVRHNCVNEEGLSAAAILDEVGDLVALNVGVVRDGDGTALLLTDILGDAQVRTLIESDVAANSPATGNSAVQLTQSRVSNTNL